MMLQISRLAPAQAGGPPDRDFDAGSAIDAFRAVTGLIRRHWPLFVILPILFGSLGAAYLAVARPVYIAKATMVIDARRVQRYQQQASTIEEPSDAVAVQTQLELLRSNAIAAAVVRNLQLSHDPELVRDRADLSDDEANAVAAGAVAANLSIARMPSTYAMTVTYQSRSPEKAARIANAIVDAYVTDQLDAKFQSTRRASLWLQDRLSELGAQANAADKAVADYKAKNNIVAADGRLVNEQQLSEASTQVAQAHAATAEAKARLDRIEEVLKQPLPDASTAEGLHNEIIVRLRQQILELQARQQLFAARYGAKHQATLNLQDQVIGLQRSISDEMGKIAQGASSDYAVAEAREQALAANLASNVTKTAATNQSLVQLRALQSAAQSSRTLYDSFLQRYMDAVQQESYPATEARLITPAVPPSVPSKPNRIGIMGASLLGGLLVGFGVAALRELMDGVFRSATQVERSLGLSCLATLPRLKQRKPPRSALAARARLAEPLPGNIIAQPPPTYRAVIDEPFSAFAEGLRAVKIAIDLASAGRSHAVIGIASTLPNEGKSTIAANLAQLIAHAGSRVLLVDADLRSPSLSHLLAPGAQGGLIDAVGDRRPLSELILVDPASQLDFLPAGAPQNLMHTNAILGGETMRVFFAAARNHYDYIIVDLSPLGPVVDARATAHFIDGYVFAIEWGATKVDVVETVLKDAHEIYDATLGIVLNKADLAILGRYDRHRGAGYQEKFYKKYGYLT